MSRSLSLSLSLLSVAGNALRAFWGVSKQRVSCCPLAGQVESGRMSGIYRQVLELWQIPLLLSPTGLSRLWSGCLGLYRGSTRRLSLSLSLSLFLSPSLFLSLYVFTYLCMYLYIHICPVESRFERRLSGQASLRLFRVEGFELCPLLVAFVLVMVPGWMSAQSACLTFRTRYSFTAARCFKQQVGASL